MKCFILPQMFFSRLKYRRNIIQSVISYVTFIFFHWHHRIHLYTYLIVTCIACCVSYYQPFGLLFNVTRFVPENQATNAVRNKLIIKQKQEQREAYEWLDNVWKNSRNYSHIISTESEQSRFYDFLQIKSYDSRLSSYQLFHQPVSKPAHNVTNITEQIVISILYSRQDTDHREGKFYVGQVLYQLLKNYHSRFIITLCENNNSNDKISDEINLIRRLVPVFIVNTISSNGIFDMYEQEKQAHLQCILANFQSFSHVNYFLLLQDDAEPVHEDFYSRFVSLIDSRVKHQWPKDGPRKQPAFVKIYHPRWLIDYLHPSLYIIVQLIATSLFLTFMSFIGFHTFQMIKQNKSKYSNHYTHGTSYNFVTRQLQYFIFYFLLITLVLILLNHSNVSWSWRSLHSSFYAIYPAPSCCLPGVLYFRQTYQQVIDYLNSVKCQNGYAIDTAFDDLPKRTQLQTYLVEPNLVHHIGLYSRLRHVYINPYLLD
ncbi:unnamed protein product [Adineta ricciae]|uniref:Uncharacterized protein n=1 Tax=Adineta ricciae TaxID=249248 RepID=A0A813SJP9_ADIRI|nr:unnamed protein product [Adineta ricciae]